jgi:hypothetical protein
MGVVQQELSLLLKDGFDGPNRTRKDRFIARVYGVGSSAQAAAISPRPKPVTIANPTAATKAQE